MATDHKEWFLTWFNSPFYHILYDHRNEEEANSFIRHLMEYLSLEIDAPVMDLACGKGRHAKVLSETGCRTIGVDLSQESISEATKMTTPNLSFAVHDMRQSYCNHCFSAVFNLFTSFGYFDSLEDNFKVVEAVFQSLQHKGIFVIDFFNAIMVEKNLVPNEVTVKQGIEFQIERRIQNGQVKKKITFHDGAEHYEFEEQVQLLKFENFKEIIQNRFRILDVFGDYQLNDFDQNTSPRLILVLEKIEISVE